MLPVFTAERAQRADQVFVLQLVIVMLLALPVSAALVLQVRAASMQEAGSRTIVGAEVFVPAPVP